MVLRNLVVVAVLCALWTHAAAERSLVSVYKKGGAVFEVDQIIGGDIDDEEYYMYRPTDLAVDSRGDLFVLDSKGHCVKKFDAQGNHLLTFGREGQGPGEMGQALRLDVDSEDNVVIFDMSGRRFSFFKNDGTFIKSIHPDGIGPGYLSDFQVHPNNGDVYVEFRNIDYRKTEPPTFVSISRLRLEPFEKVSIDSITVWDTQVLRIGQGMKVSVAPFPPQLYWGILPGGNIVTANSDNYVIRIYSPDLTRIDEHTVDKRKQKVTDVDKEEYFGRYEGDPDIARVRRNTNFPKHKPHFTKILIDDEGFILLRVREGGDEGDTYDVLGPDGSYFNQVTLPRLGYNSAVSRRFIYSIKLHEERDMAVYRYALSE